jgi:hypothetical protein
LDFTGHQVRGFASIRRRGPEQTSRYLETERIVLLCIMEFCCSW